MKIYTRAGDDGSTGLLGPGRVPKNAARIEAFGAVDELNAVLGVARAQDPGSELATELEALQASLFALGAELATVAPGIGGPRIQASQVEALEASIDRLDLELAPLTNFILPAGTPLAAQLHFARTVCRRAERRVVALAQADPVGGEVLRYLNRLADLLFVMARVANRRAGVADTVWRP